MSRSTFSRVFVAAFFTLCFFISIGPVHGQTQVGMDIDGEADDNWSGWSVSLSSDGNRVAIGAIYNADAGAMAGHVRVYDWVEGSWTQVGQDIDGEAANDQSGHSVSLSADGSRLAIGAIGNTANAGHVRVYDLIGGVWTKVGQDIDGEMADDQSGFSVSLSADGSHVAIGAPFNDDSGNNAGYVRVYNLVVGTWTQVGQDIGGQAANDQSGFSVSLSADGSRVAIGAPFNDDIGNNGGHVRVYDLITGAWTQVDIDIDGEAANDQSGYSVSLSADGSRVAIGAINNDDSGANAGHVRLFDLLGGVWTQVGQDIDGEAGNDQSGIAVSLSSDGSRVAIGAHYNGGSGDFAGHVRIYDLMGLSWTQVGQDIDGEAALDLSGYSLSLSPDGSRVAIGSWTNGVSGSYAGHVRVYDPDASSGGVLLNLTVFLAGPHIGGAMNTALNSAGFIPLAQPYNSSPFNYAGTETVTSIPADMVDWVLVELRDGPLASDFVGRRAGILRSNGQITDLDGSPLELTGVGDASYHIVVFHRNHLAIMSADLLAISGSVSYDFTGALTQAFGTNPMRDIGGEFVMWGGDGNSSGDTTAFDFLNIWLAANGGAPGYLAGDFDLSSSATAFDFLNVWLPANGVASQVPSP